MKSTLQNKKAWLLFLLPSIAIFIFTVIFPILRSAYFGFFDWDGVTPMHFTGLTNYRKLFQIYISEMLFGTIYFIF